MTSDFVYRTFDKALDGRLPHYRRYRDFLVYSFFGTGTFLVSIGTYALFSEHLGWNELISNAASWIFSTLFAFLTNRIFVFLNRRHGFYAFWIQLSGFAAGRFLTLVVEEILLYILVSRMMLPNMLVKLGTTMLVVLLNYIVSKLFVFRKKQENHSEDSL